MAAFMDLHVKHCEPKLLAEKLLQAEHLGYEVVAINYFLEDLSKAKQKGKKETQPVIPNAEDIKLPTDTIKQLKWKRKPPKQLSRLTTQIKDSSQTHKLTSQEVQSYDLIAVEPTNEKAFQLACLTLDIDIIVIDVTQRLPFFIKRPSVHSALLRGVHFELQYAPSLHDSTIRRQMISNATSLVDTCKGKNVIISSACVKPFDLRGPHDVANLAHMFGMNEVQGRATVCNNCRAVLCHAEARKVFKSTVTMKKISSQSEDNSCTTSSPKTKKAKKSGSINKQSSGVKNHHRKLIDEEENNIQLTESTGDSEPPHKRLKTIMDSVEDYVRKWAKAEDSDLNTLSEWIKSIRMLVKRRIGHLRKEMSASESESSVACCWSVPSFRQRPP